MLFSNNTLGNVKVKMAELLGVKVVDRISKYLGSYVNGSINRKTIG